MRMVLSCRAAGCALALLLMMMLGSGWAAAAEPGLERQVEFAIPAQALLPALYQFSTQAKVQVLTKAADVTNARTAGVSGHLAIQQALTELLQNTGFSFQAVDASTLAITALPVANTQQSLQPTDVALQVTQQDRTDSSTASSVETLTRKPQSNVTETDEIVVVGSRIPQSAKDSAVPVEVYSRQKIDQSGASTLTEFLNTLPEASVQSTTTGQTQHYAGASTIQLRGLPAGTTLVLVNGRRVESASGTAASYFDLNQIPLAAIERLEVLPTGSSAVYGGDGLGGVVNIVLRQGFEGVAADARYGGTGDGAYHETQYSLTAGWKSDTWSFSVIGFYSQNSELSGNERALTADNNFTPFGGKDATYTFADPGNVCTTNGTNLHGLGTACAGIPHGSTGVGLTAADFAATAGILNKTSLFYSTSMLPSADRSGTFAYGTYQLAPSVQVFTELLFNHLSQRAYQNPPLTSLSVPATNPYNPFGQAVTVSYLFNGLGRDCYCESADYVRPLLGMRGSLFEKWSWEVAGWTSRDWEDLPRSYGITNTGAINAALANGTFNPFQDGPGAAASTLSTFYGLKTQKYRAALDSVNGFVRGPLAELPAGTVEAVLGAEYQHDTLASEVPAVNIASNYDVHRESDSGFAEVKVPIVGNRGRVAGGDILSAQIAVRYDRYSDFGSRTSPAAGLEFRPVASVLLRAAYSAAFKPPSLFQLQGGYVPSTVAISDPLRGGQSEVASLISGGNRNLQAETGRSSNLGVVFSPQSLPDLNVSLTHWAIHIDNGFINPSASQVVSFQEAFPGRIVRAAPSAGDPYTVGVIASVNTSVANFGYIDERGVDFGINWRKETQLGTFSPSVAVTQTYRYQFELNPAVGAQNAVSQANDSAQYAPRWKGTAALAWSWNTLQLGVTGRYTGWYRDVTDRSANPRGLGDFWYVDGNARYELGKALLPTSRFLSQAFVAAGVRNAFNKLPPYSDYNNGNNGYDANEYDIEGRVIWGQVGVRF